LQTGDTIAAISSAVGPAARMIVRMSGGQSHAIASQIASDILQQVSRCRLRLRDFEFFAWIYSFRAPRSYSGEDTTEFHIPGNPLLARMLLDELIARGARHAEPGEFTARAYFNGRLDLSQAEGVAATIAASSDAELRAARQLLAGELARRVKPAMESLADALALIEVGIDFSEEDVEFISADEMDSRIESIDKLLDQLLNESVRFERLHHTPQIVLVGKPNAGKSTLLNALAGTQRAVVSPEAGTTRDALSVDVVLPRGIARLIDVAGIEPPNLDDAISRQMQQRALATLESADRVVLVRDRTDGAPDLKLPRPPDLVVRTKGDLTTTPISREYRPDSLLVSAHTAQDMESLRVRLDKLAFGSATGSSLALNARHIQSIQAAREALARAKTRTRDGGAELVAVELREALDALGEIVGQVSPDDVLGRIFAGFCIGK
jgi:tRNA modification GTPase